jgi:serine/threonine protein kinase
MTMADRERHMPRRWGEYLICKKIGRGGFCKVYQAIHQASYHF